MVKPRVRTSVEWWSDEEGWGALVASPEAPGGVFVHFSAIEMEGFKSLRAGQQVEALIVGPLPYEQEGYRYEAREVRPVARPSPAPVCGNVPRSTPGSW